MNKKDLVAIRKFDPETDINFIFSTWLKGLRFGNDWFLAIDSQTYFHNYQKVIEAIIAKPQTTIPIACFKEDPGVILAYAVLTGDKLHWAFTKPAWRQMGLAKSIIPKTLKTVTHLTKIGRAMLPAGVTFDPFSI